MYIYAQLHTHVDAIIRMPTDQSHFEPTNIIVTIQRSAT